MPHSMGELKAKLRSRFPRRNSGILSLAVKTSTHSTSGSDTQSRPLSECTPNNRIGYRPSSSSEHGDSVPASPNLGVASGKESLSGDGLLELVDGKSSHSSTKLQATAAPGAAGEAKDRLRQKGAKQGPIARASHSADVRLASVETDTDDGDASSSLHQFEAGQVSAAAANRVDGCSGAKNATDASMPAVMHPINALPTPATAPTGDSLDMNGNDQRVSMAKLSSINEHSTSGIATNINWNSSAANSDRNPAAQANALDNTSPTSTAPAEPLRRIELRDPSAGLPHASLTSSNLNPSNSQNLHNSSSISRRTRQQSLFPSRQNTLIRTLLGGHPDDVDAASADLLLPITANMVTRKIWVKRPGASATLITINEEDLVDDVREMILRKYANSLGRSFDAPDLTLRIAPREPQRQERVLGPEEPMARTLDAYFPGGQTVDEALIIDIPSRRTPRPSPRTGPPHAQHITSAYFEDNRPHEAGTDYFGPEAVSNPGSSASAPVPNGTAHPHTISVLSTGQIPQIPSPGGTRAKAYRDRPDRPRLNRHHTSSPTILNVVGSQSHAAGMAATGNHGMQSCSR